MKALLVAFMLLFNYLDTPKTVLSLVYLDHMFLWVTIIHIEILWRWFLDIFNVKVLSENDRQSIQIIHQTKFKDFLVIYRD